MAFTKQFFRFVIPSIVSMWVFSLYSMVDGLFVAKGVGELALAAVNLSMPYTTVIFTIGILFATGTSTVISIALGQKDLARARNFFNQNIVVVAAISLIITVITLFNLEPLALFLGATPSTLEYVKEYVGVIACFFVFFTVSYNLEIQIKANGAPHVSIAGVVACALMNVLLDYVFVMRLGWGVWGAALATGLSQVTSTTVFVLYFLTHTKKLRLEKFTLDLGAYRRILPLGLSDGLTELANGVVIFLFNHMILRVIGEGGLVSYTIISYVNTLVLMTMTGTTQGIQPLTSFHLGAGETKLCHRLLIYGVGLVAIFSAMAFAISQLGAGGIVGLFLHDGDVLFAPSVDALHMYGSAFLVVGFNVILAGFFTAMNRPHFALPISFCRGLVFLCVLLPLLSTRFGEIGIWYTPLASELLCLLLSAFFLWRYLRSVRRKTTGTALVR